MQHRAFSVIAMAVVTSCTHDVIMSTAVSDPDAAIVLGVVPASGATNVDPSAPLRSRMTYVLHLLPTLVDAAGRAIDFGYCAGRTGGQPASVTGRGMPGRWSGGMVFPFTTSDMDDRGDDDRP